MLGKLKKLITNPKKYVPLVIRMLQQKMCVFFQDTSFFMQGQMDIHSKSRWYNEDFVRTTGGFYVKGDSISRKIYNLEPWDNTRRDMLILLLRTIIINNIEGELAELGVYKGYTAKLIHHYVPERKLHLFDTFEGFPNKSIAVENHKTNLKVSNNHFADTSLEVVQKYISAKNDNVFYYKGYFPNSMPSEFGKKQFAFVHLDADLYEPTFEGLHFFYPRITINGMIVVHDYNTWPGARKAVEEFFADKKELPIPMPDKSGSVLIIKLRA